jgi:hypothetical protein
MERCRELASMCLLNVKEVCYCSQAHGMIIVAQVKHCAVQSSMHNVFSVMYQICAPATSNVRVFWDYFAGV